MLDNRDGFDSQIQVNHLLYQFFTVNQPDLCIFFFNKIFSTGGEARGRDQNPSVVACDQTTLESMDFPNANAILRLIPLRLERYFYVDKRQLASTINASVMGTAGYLDI